MNESLRGDRSQFSWSKYRIHSRLILATSRRILKTYLRSETFDFSSFHYNDRERIDDSDIESDISDSFSLSDHVLFIFVVLHWIDTKDISSCRSLTTFYARLQYQIKTQSSTLQFCMSYFLQFQNSKMSQNKYHKKCDVKEKKCKWIHSYMQKSNYLDIIIYKFTNRNASTFKSEYNVSIIHIFYNYTNISIYNIWKTTFFNTMHIYLQIHHIQKCTKLSQTNSNHKNPFLILMHVHFHTNANTSLTWNDKSSVFLMHDFRTSDCVDAEIMRNDYVTIFYEKRFSTGSESDFFQSVSSYIIG